MSEKRTHKAMVEATHINMSQEQIRAAKCARRREKNLAQRKINRENTAERRNPAEQLARLDERLGKGVGAKRERTKLLLKLGKA